MQKSARNTNSPRAQRDGQFLGNFHFRNGQAFACLGHANLVLPHLRPGGTEADGHRERESSRPTRLPGLGERLRRRLSPRERFSEYDLRPLRLGDRGEQVTVAAQPEDRSRASAGANLSSSAK